jgi:dienelactone hydrolase
MRFDVFTEAISYQDGSRDLEAFVAYPSVERRPLVILCHAWRGKDEFICDKAREVAQWGYVGFALDMYGKGILGKSKDENAALKRPFVEDRDMLQKRVIKAFEVACSLPYVDVSQIAVLGYGFGGICALDLARAGADLKGAISVYGHFDSPPQSLKKQIKAKILILHGYHDKIVPQEELDRFEREMNAAKVDWQAHIYGGTMHAFATPGANDPQSGILYNSTAASRSWIAIYNFLNEIFSSIS